MLVDFDDPCEALFVGAGDTETGCLQPWTVLRVETEVAVEVLLHFARAVQRRCARTRHQFDPVRLTDQRACQRGNDEGVAVRGRLGMVGGCQPKNVPCVLDQYVLEAASGADEGDTMLAG